MTIAVAIVAFDEAQILDIAMAVAHRKVSTRSVARLFAREVGKSPAACWRRATCAWTPSRAAPGWAAKSGCAGRFAAAWA